MVQAHYLVVFLIATTAAKTSSEELINNLRASEGLESFELESTSSTEENVKRSLYDRLWNSGKGVVGYDNKIEEIFEVEMPVREEVVVSVPWNNFPAPIEVPLPGDRPYTVEVRLSVPEPSEYPIKVQVPVPDSYSVDLPLKLNRPAPIQFEKLHDHIVSVPHDPFSMELYSTLQDSYSLAKKPTVWPYDTLSENKHPLSPPSILYEYFPSPIKADFSVIKSHPVLTEIPEIKSLLEPQFVEEFSFPSIYPCGKTGNHYKKLFPKPYPTKVLIEEPLSYVEPKRTSFEELFIKPYPLAFSYPEYLPTVIEKPTLIPSRGNPFSKYYPKTRFEAINTKLL